MAGGKEDKVPLSPTEAEIRDEIVNKLCFWLLRSTTRSIWQKERRSLTLSWVGFSVSVWSKARKKNRKIAPKLR